ncbi:MAG: methyltransferase domain-containing protein [Bradymonadia bacterium]
MTTPLEAHQAALAHVHGTDFRSANLYRMVNDRLLEGSVLDVGCGSGGLVSWLLDQGRDARGIDHSDATIDTARAHLSLCGHDPARVSTEDLAALVAQGHQVDNVVSMDCLEHVADDRGFLSHMVRLVRPGGRLVITVPALMAVFGPRDEAVGHHRRYHRGDLLDLVADEPLDLMEMRYWNLLGVPPAFLYAKVLKSQMNESFRWGKPNLRKRLLRKGLHTWFAQVERRIVPPLGLTLLMVCTRR